MPRFVDIPVVYKLPAMVIALVAAILVASLVTVIGSVRSSSYDAAKTELEWITSWQAEAVDRQVRPKMAELNASAKDELTLLALSAFSNALQDVTEEEAYQHFQSANPTVASGPMGPYMTHHSFYDARFRSMLETNNLSDVLLIDLTGRVVYSVGKKEDLGANVADPMLADSGLARAVRRAEGTDDVILEGFSTYIPAPARHEAFLAHRILDSMGVQVGTLVASFQPMAITGVLGNVAEMSGAKTVALVGADGTLFGTTASIEGTITTSIPDDVWPLVTSGTSGSFDSTADPLEESLYVVTPVGLDGAGWTIVARKPLMSAYARGSGLIQAIMVRCALLFGIGTVLAIALGRTQSNPMRRLAQEVEQIADGDLNDADARHARKDEFGAIEAALDGLRTRLRLARTMEREAAMKGAGFQGSSAPMLLTDRENRTLYVNDPMRQVLTQNKDELALEDPDTALDSLMGTPLAQVHPDVANAVQELGQDDCDHVKMDIEFAGMIYALNARTVRNSEGVWIGNVVEWFNVTDARLQQALLSSIDAHLVIGRFDTARDVGFANASFAALLGAEDPESLGQTPLSQIVFAPSGGEDRRLDEIFEGEGTASGRFRFDDQTGGESWVAGGVSTLGTNRQGERSYLFVGQDITEAQLRLQQERRQRDELEAAQAHVVDTLRVALQRLANGDLTVGITSAFADAHESLRADFNVAVTSLLEAMLDVLENTQTITSESAEINRAANDLSRRTEQQAATLEETAAALDELTSSVASAADGARRAKDVVDDARGNAQKSGQIVQQAVDAMGEISQSSQQISKIIGVIDEIAFQTNLLALNAGVEAARAGDAGRGFAVVASEVRALAQRSSEAAREINELISVSSSNVGRGVGLVNDTGEALREIVTSVSRIADLVAEIAQSAQEQSSGLAEINIAVNQLDQVTQQNAAMFEETSAASHSLTAGADTLLRTTSKFQVGVQPQAAPAPSPEVTPPTKDAAARAPMAVGQSQPTFVPDEDDWQEF